MKTLQALRQEIDAIDDELLQLLQKRLTVVKQIGIIKKELGAAILDEKRRDELLEQKSKKAESLKLSKEFIRQLFTLIHDYAVDVQKKI